QAFQASDRALVQPPLQRHEVRIVAAVEAEHEAGALEPRLRLACPARIQVHRLLAEHRLARVQRGQRLVQVPVGGAADQHAAHAGSSDATAAPVRPAIARADSPRGSTTYFRRRPGVRAALGPWTWPIRPAPIRTTSTCDMQRAPRLPGGSGRTRQWN